MLTPTLTPCKVPRSLTPAFLVQSPVLLLFPGGKSPTARSQPSVSSQHLPEPDLCCNSRCTSCEQSKEVFHFFSLKKWHDPYEYIWIAQSITFKKQWSTGLTHAIPRYLHSCTWSCFDSESLLIFPNSSPCWDQFHPSNLLCLGREFSSNGFNLSVRWIPTIPAAAYLPAYLSGGTRFLMRNWYNLLESVTKEWSKSWQLTNSAQMWQQHTCLLSI